MTPRRSRVVMIAFASALAIVLSESGHAAASPPSVPTYPPPTRPISWLAAGNSYSSGQGLAYEVGPCAQAREEGQGELGAWGVEAADLLKGKGNLSLEASSPDLVACTSATSANFLSPQGKDPAQWNASDPRYDLVSFTFGGDNVGFADVVDKCLGLDPAGIISGTSIAWGAALLGPLVGPATALEAWTADPFVHCQSNAALRGQIRRQLVPAYEKFLRNVADQAVTPGGNIVVLGYPEFVEDPKLWSTVDKDAGLCQGIRPGDAEELRGLAGDLNATIAGAVHSINAEHPNNVKLTYVDVNTGDPAVGIPYNDQNLFEPSTGARHNLCAAQEWLNGITVQFHGVSLPDFHHSFHPNEAGNDAMAALVEQVFPQLDWSHLAATPTLGQLWAPDQLGYGKVAPSMIDNGGDPEGIVSNVVWRSWGSAEAIGSGVAEYVGPNQIVADGTQEPATVVAFNLGMCDGRYMYQAIEWYFPEEGQAFDANNSTNICTILFAPSTLP